MWKLYNKTVIFYKFKILVMKVAFHITPVIPIGFERGITTEKRLQRSNSCQTDLLFLI